MKKSLMVIVYWITLFAVTLSGADVCRAANYDIEPDNDKRIYAKEVTFGDKIVGNLWHALDYDWYAVNVPYAGTVSLTAYYEFPSGSTADTDVLFVEVRSVENEVISDFFIDYMDYKTNTPYIRDINIPSSGNYYIVVHCPSQAKFKRDRYYLTMARGAGENANVFILNEEDSVSVQVHDQGGAVDARSKATLTASVTDEAGNPVAGAMVVFSRAFGDSINPKNNELVFSGKDVDLEGITKNFFLFSGEKDITVTYNAPQYTRTEGGITTTFSAMAYFKAQLINTETGEKTYLYSVNNDVTNVLVTKNILSNANYYLDITAQNGTDDIWEVKIPNKSFSTTSDEIGTAVTGSDGKAHYTYISTDQKGDFTITASFGNSSDKLVVKQTAGTPSKVNILDLVENPDNDLLYINREYILNVAVTDKNGNLVEDDTEINLASSPSGLTIKNSTAKTKSGMAKFTISSATAKEYTLTAIVKGNTTIKDTLSVKFNTITLSNMMAQPAYVLADGKSTSTISVRLSNSNGLAVSGEPVSFTTNCGTLLSNTTKTADKTDTASGTEQGVAKVFLVAPSTPGTCTVTASYGTAKLTTQVIFYQDGTGTTSSIELTSSSNTVAANGTSSVVLTAKLLDSTGENVVAGTSVKFTTDKGIFPNGRQDFEGNMPPTGEVKVALISQLGQVGKANITCSSGGISQSIQITFTPVNSDGSPAGESTAYINLTASPATIPADGKSSLMISAELFNSKGETVPAGTEIVFYAANGKFSNGLLEFTAATTDENGKVYVALVSSLTPGPVDVWCLSNGVYQLTTVTFKGGNVTPDIGNIILEANPANVSANGASSSSITATLTDTSGNPVPAGTSVVFTAAPAGIGKFSNGTATITVTTQDDSGKITVPLISAGAAGGLVQVIVTSGGASQSTLVTFKGSGATDIGSITLAANPITVPADGISSTSITAVVTDRAGQPVPAGTVIDFTTAPAGIAKFSTGTTTRVSTPDDTGTVIVPLISAGATAGTAEVTAKSGGVSQKVIVTFKGSSPTDIGSILLTAAPETIPADGASTLTVTATLYDTSKKPVKAGTEAIFYASSGTFVGGSGSYITALTTDASGKVNVTLVASTTAGKSDITCYSNEITEIITVYFTGINTEPGSVASITLSALPSSIPADGKSSSTITITLKDNKGAPVVKGTSVTISTTLGTLSKTNISTVDDTGVVSVSLMAGTTAGTARVVCTALSGVTQTTTVIFTGGTSATPTQLGLALSQIAVKTDNSDSTTITATVLDENTAVIPDVPVSFVADGGQLSAAIVKTDANGQAKVQFSSGSIDKSNRVVNVTATVSPLDPKTIPVQITGSTISLSNTATSLILDDPATPAVNEANSSELTITAKDAGGKPVYNAPIQITHTGSIAWTTTALTATINGIVCYTTNINGQIILSVTGTGTGSGTIDMKWYDTTGIHSTTAMQPYTVAAPKESFGIILPADDLTKINTGTKVDTNPADDPTYDGNGIFVTVYAPTQTNVRFSTTMGGIGTRVLHSDVQVKEVAVNPITKEATVVVRSALAGVATIEVSDKDNPATVDRVTVAFVRPDSDAATIKVQSNTSVIPPSVGANKSIAEFTAYVKTSGDTGSQAVAGVPVVFSIDNSTGSGESVSPVIVYTNEAGEAKTTFTAGSLGSDAEGVTVNARVVGSATTGTSSAISFTAATRTIAGAGLFGDFKADQQIKVSGSNLNDGYYTVKTANANSLILSDGDSLNDEPIGAAVTITALTHSTNIVIGGTAGSVVIGRGAGDSIVILNPTTYSLAMSVLVADLNGNPVSGADVSLSLWPERYNTGVWYDLNDKTTDHYVPYITGSFINEDRNENTSLDPGEDENKDGILTPPNSAAGNIPTLLTTNEDGYAVFDIIYLKSSAVWIDSRITATTMVFGTETKSTMTFTLPAEKVEAEAGYLPDSPYPYVLKCPSGGAADFRLPAFAGISNDTFSPWIGTAVGVVGTEVYKDDDPTKPVLYYTSYDYEYDDTLIVSPVGTTLYDWIAVSDLFCGTSFPIKIVIE